MRRYVPFPYKVTDVVVILSIEIEYFEKDIVWENADCCCESVTLACATQSRYSLQSSRGAKGRTLTA